MGLDCVCYLQAECLVCVNKCEPVCECADMQDECVYQ